IFGSHDYVGPFFLSCDHGCYHGPSSHGYGYGPDAQHRLVSGLCLGALHRADLIFAWIDSRDCYGTLVELGYAKSMGKRIVIAGPRYFKDLWFCYALASEPPLIDRHITPGAAL